FGFDYNRGRLDISVHPFEIQFSRDDVRLTTRYHEDFLNPALFGTLHETGHGLHAQGFGTSIEGTYLSDLDAGSGAIAESQSRMWENVIGRSRGFWKWAYPKLKDTFPAQLANKAVQDVPSIPDDITRGKFDTLLNWATTNLYQHGRKFTVDELVRRVTDKPIQWQPYVAYLEAKFKEIFRSW